MPRPHLKPRTQLKVTSFGSLKHFGTWLKDRQESQEEPDPNEAEQNDHSGSEDTLVTDRTHKSDMSSEPGSNATLLTDRVGIEDSTHDHLDVFAKDHTEVSDEEQEEEKDKFDIHTLRHAISIHSTSQAQHQPINGLFDSNSTQSSEPANPASIRRMRSDVAQTSTHTTTQVWLPYQPSGTGVRKKNKSLPPTFLTSLGPDPFDPDFLSEDVLDIELSLQAELDETPRSLKDASTFEPPPAANHDSPKGLSRRSSSRMAEELSAEALRKKERVMAAKQQREKLRNRELIRQMSIVSDTALLDREQSELVRFQSYMQEKAIFLRAASVHSPERAPKPLQRSNTTGHARLPEDRRANALDLRPLPTPSSTDVMLLSEPHRNVISPLPSNYHSTPPPHMVATFSESNIESHTVAEYLDSDFGAPPILK